MLYILFTLLIIIAFYIYRGYRSRLKINVTLTSDDKKSLSDHVHFYRGLDTVNKGIFEQKITDFLSYIRIEGVGTTIGQLDRLLVASSAIIPIFGFDKWKYNNLTSVLLYPDTFNKDFQFEGAERQIMGMVGEGYMNGQMILSRAALLLGFSNAADKENTGIHEFVHLLDKSDGATDGIPENLMKHEYTLPWIKMVHQEMQRIEKGKSDINPYATTNEAEFLAVVSEYFFEKPEQFKKKHPELYDILAQTFLQDPVGKKV